MNAPRPIAGLRVTLAGLALAGLVFGCQSQGSQTAKTQDGSSEHPTARPHSGGSTPSTASEHPTAKANPATTPAAKTSAAGTPATAPKGGPGEEVCMLPPDAQLDAVSGIKVGQVMPMVAVTDIRTGKPVNSADYKDKYLLLHYWVSW